MVDVLGWLTECVSSLFSCVLIGYLISLKFKSRRKMIIIISIILAIISPTANLVEKLQKHRTVEASKNSQLNPVFSSADEAKIREIIAGVIRNKPEYLTKDVHDQFWAILKKYGYSPTESDLNKIKDLFSSTTMEMEYFYKDALISYQTGRAMKSDIREQYEEKLLKEHLITQEKLIENEELLKKIALHESITSNGKTVTFNEEIINQALENLNQADQRLTDLYMSTQIKNTINTESKLPKAESNTPNTASNSQGGDNSSSQEEISKLTSTKTNVTNYTMYNGNWTDSDDYCGNGYFLTLQFTDKNVANVLLGAIMHGTKAASCLNNKPDNGGGGVIIFDQNGMGTYTFLDERDGQTQVQATIKLTGNKVFLTTKYLNHPQVGSTLFGDNQTTELPYHNKK